MKYYVKKQKTIALILICVMLLNITVNINPNNIYAEIGADDFTFNIMEDKDKPIEGATVSYSTVSGSAISIDTNELGYATFDLSSLEASERELGINAYSVSKHGYEDIHVASGSAISFDIGTYPIIMERLPLVELTGNISLDGKPIVGASVEITGYDNYDAITDKEGNYVISDIYGTRYEEAKEYSFSASHPDFLYYSSSITITNNNIIKSVHMEEKLNQDLSFKNTDPSPIDILSAPSLEYFNPLIGEKGSGPVTYQSVTPSAISLDYGPDVATIDSYGKVSFKKPGVIKVKATKLADETYKSADAFYEIIFKKADVNDFVFTDPNPIAINTESIYKNQAFTESNMDGRTITYTVLGEDPIADVDSSNGSISNIKGVGIIEIQAIISESTFFNQAIATYRIKINKSIPGVLNFMDPNPEDIPWNQRFTNAVIPDEGKYTGSISYESSDISIAEVNHFGEVIAKKPGLVEITAKLENDRKYEDTLGSYRINFTLAEDVVKFGYDSDKLFRNYGEEFINTASAFGDGKIRYEIKSGNKIANIDRDGGNLSFYNGKTGVIKVKAVKEADSLYKAAFAEYTLTVTNLEIPDSPYTISGDTENDSGWFIGNVKITAKEGYQISYSNRLNTDNVWTEHVSYDKEGNDIAEIYLRDIITGGITGVIVTDEIMLDSYEPSYLGIDYVSQPIYEFEVFSVKHLFYNDNVNIKLKAKDINSGINRISYKKIRYGSTESETLVEIPKSMLEFRNDEAFATISINEKFVGNLAFKVEDVAGNITELYIDSATKLVVNNTNPVLNIKYSDPKAQVGIDGRMIADINGDTTFIYNGYSPINVELEITDEFFIEDNIILKVKRKAPSGQKSEEVYRYSGSNGNYLHWTKSNKTHRANISLNKEGEYVLEVSYDNYTNKEMKYQSVMEKKEGFGTYTSNKLVIDSTSPEISAETGSLVSNQDSPVTLYIKEKNFCLEDLNTDIVATDIQGNPMSDVNIQELIDHLENEENWINNEDTWSTTLVFAESANYDISLSYTDKAGNSKMDFKYYLTVDKRTPNESDLTITYSESILDEIINTITFGFYKAAVKVTVSATDDISGINSFEYMYISELGLGDFGDQRTIPKKDIIYSDSGRTATASFYINPEFRGNIAFRATDAAGNDTAFLNDTRTLVVDSISPTRTVTMNPIHVVDYESLETKEYDSEDEKLKLFFNEKAEVNIEIKESNFFPEDVVIKVIQNDKEIEMLSEAWEKTADTWTSSITINGEGQYIVVIDYMDRSTNTMDTYTSNIIIIDDTAPIISVSRSDTPINIVEGMDYYSGQIQVEVEVVEHNFRPEDISASIIAETVDGNRIDIEDRFSNHLKDIKNWDKDGDRYTTILSFDADGRYKLELDYLDLSLNDSKELAGDEFVIDQVGPVNTGVSYSTSVMDAIIETISFGFYTAPVTVTIQAEDNVSGIYAFEYRAICSDDASESNTLEAANLTGEISLEDIEFTNDGKTAKGTFQIPAQFRGNIDFTAKDRSGNSKEHMDSRIIVVDSITPSVTMSYNTPKLYVDKNNNKVSSTSDSPILLYSNDVDLEIAIKEANFFEGKLMDNGEAIHDVKIIVKKEGIDSNSEIEYVPYATNAEGKSELVWEHDKDVHKAFIKLKGDGDYTVSVTYKDKSDNEMVYMSEYDSNQGSYTYKSNVIRIDKTKPIVEIGVPEKMTNKNMSIGLTVKEHNFNPEDLTCSITGKDIDLNILSDLNTSQLEDQLRSITNWNQTSKDIWQISIEFTQSANYTIEFLCTDKAGNISEKQIAEFVIDKEGPEEDKLKISYSTPIISKLIDSITFGYYKEPAIVTLEATDTISGVKYFEYKLIEGVSGEDKEQGQLIRIEGDNKGLRKLGTASFEIPPEYIGKVYFHAVDVAGNTSLEVGDDNVVVVDSISPTRTVTMNPIHVVDRITLDTINEYKESSDTKLFFSKDAALQIVVNEANFYQEDVIVSVSKNGQPFASAFTDPWVKSNDDWTTKIILLEDGEYIVRIDYSDRSSNTMVSYTSDIIVIDTIAPTIQTDITNEPINIIDGIEYYDNKQDLIISITDRNFRPKDVIVDIKALTVDGNTVDLENYNNYLVDSNNWTKKGDAYSAVLTFDKDANYIFDISYKDLALNEAQEYEPISFTIDTGFPTNLNVSYSSPILSVVAEVITFGFYDSKTTVEISAEDHISGINYFTYSYSNDQGEAVTDRIIERDNIKYSADGRIATASLTMPSASGNDHGQYRGTISFKAYDCSENLAKYEDGRITIVDNKTPNLEVNYNEPVKIKEDIYYYDGDVNINFNISEDNFYPEEFESSITWNKEPVAEIQPTWNKNGSIWVGSIDIQAYEDSSKDGIYEISASYTDRSNNTMHPYKSSRIIIDTTKPSISISGIDDLSANKEETIGFDILISDTNHSVFEPSIYGVFMDESNKVYEEKIDAGELITLTEGKEYIYRIENLERDGIYSINCIAEDLAGNYSETMKVLGKGVAAQPQEKSSITFSVNRNGSTFFLNPNTIKIVDAYYVRDVSEAIILSEINVDSLEKIDITLNNQQLADGKDFVVEEESHKDGWYRYNYILKESLFSKEGSYSIIVKSLDKAGSVSYSDIKKAELSFVVDKTKPELVVSGISSDGRYKATSKEVILMPKDPGGEISKLRIMLNNDQTIVDLDSEMINDLLQKSEGKITFELPSGMGQAINISCVDYAGNENQVVYDNITISTDWFILFYANKQLFWSVIATASVMIVGTSSFILVRKKRLKIKHD